MAPYQDLPVFADIYALTHKVFFFTQDYPREYKFTLGQDMKRLPGSFAFNLSD